VTLKNYRGNLQPIIQNSHALISDEFSKIPIKTNDSKMHKVLLQQSMSSIGKVPGMNSIIFQRNSPKPILSGDIMQQTVH
jgi:hypothetical protein